MEGEEGSSNDVASQMDSQMAESNDLSLLGDAGTSRTDQAGTAAGNQINGNSVSEYFTRKNYHNLFFFILNCSPCFPSCEVTKSAYTFFCCMYKGYFYN